MLTCFRASVLHCSFSWSRAWTSFPLPVPSSQFTVHSAPPAPPSPLRPVRIGITIATGRGRGEAWVAVAGGRRADSRSLLCAAASIGSWRRRLSDCFVLVRFVRVRACACACASLLSMSRLSSFASRVPLLCAFLATIHILSVVFVCTILFRHRLSTYLLVSLYRYARRSCTSTSHPISLVVVHYRTPMSSYHKSTHPTVAYRVLVRRIDISNRTYFGLDPRLATGVLLSATRGEHGEVRCVSPPSPFSSRLETRVRTCARPLRVALTRPLWRYVF